MSKQTFTANQILTAAQMNTLQTNDYNQTVSTKTASYTLVAADAGTQVAMNNASATTITVNTSLFTAGDSLTISNIGAGVTTVTAGTATVSSAGPLAVPQYGGGRLVFTSASAAIYYPSAVTAAAASSGLTFIAGGALSGTSFNVTNCFSATYKNYVIYLNSFNVPAAEYVGFKISSSSVHSYNLTDQTGSGAGPSGVNSGTTAASIFITYTASTLTSAGYINVQSPYLATNTSVLSFLAPGQAANNFSSAQGVVKDTTSYTGFTLTSGATSMSGDYLIYGYALS